MVETICKTLSIRLFDSLQAYLFLEMTYSSLPNWNTCPFEVCLASFKFATPLNDAANFIQCIE